jgi:two-component system, LuxR family, sensor kinase FixL
LPARVAAAAFEQGHGLLIAHGSPRRIDWRIFWRSRNHRRHLPVRWGVVLVNRGSNENSNSARQAIPQHRPSVRSRHLVWQWTAITGFVIAYLVLEWISFIHEYKGLPLTPWNPGLGLAFACLILIGARYGIALFAGIIVAEIVVLQSNLEWAVIVAIAAIIASGYTFIATVIRKQFRLDVGLTHLRDVIILLGAGFVGATCVTLLLVAVLLAVGELGFADIVSAAPTFIVGDVLGIAVTTPLLLRFARQWREQTLYLPMARIPEVALFVAVLIVALWLIARTESADGYRLFYLFFLPVVFVAVRHGLDGACLALAATQFGLVGLLHHHGYDWWVFMQFQVLMFVLTATGLIVGVVVSERQQTERVARESEARLKEKEAEVAHAARFSLVSGMASALAHEINQPMAAARALGRSVQVLLRSPQADLTRADKNLTTLIAEIDLASGILRRMRDFLRRGRPQISTINVPSMLDDTLMLIRPEALARNVMIDLDCPADLPEVYGDRIQLQQVILNLVRNAVDSIVTSGQSNGRIQITARRQDDSADLLEIDVLDNGPGIPADLVDHLFKPLTTSKKEGLGLGLSICFAIVEAHGGRIWLHSSEAGATEFRLSLPLEPPEPM